LATPWGHRWKAISPPLIRARYGRFTDFLQDHPVGTDDTEYAVLNALILLECGLDLTASARGISGGAGS